jgi:hypothetical protein
MDEKSTSVRRFLPDDPSEPEVYQAGYDIIQALLARARPLFEKHGKSLSFKEYNDPRFRASAGRDPHDDAEFSVIFSPSVSTILFREISAFVDMAADRFGNETFSEAFGDVTGPQSIGILPEGWSRLECRDTIFERALVWLFHHETSHIFQDHFEVRARNGDVDVAMTSHIEEVAEVSGNLAPDSRLSWVYHATELAADHEALHYSLFYDSLSARTPSAGHISTGSIWCFVCAVSFMFHYFYADREYATISPVAEGSHPDPTIRLATLTAHLHQMLQWDVVRKSAQDLASDDVLGRQISAAEAAMGAYWSHRRPGQALALPAVLGRLMACQKEILAYMKTLATVWTELRGDVLKLYFGESLGYVMNIGPPLGLEADDHG